MKDRINWAKISIRKDSCMELLDGCNKDAVLAMAKEYSLDAKQLLKWQKKALSAIKKFNANPAVILGFEVIPLLDELKEEFIRTFFPELLN